MLDRLTRQVIAAPKAVLTLAAMLLIAMGLYGLGAAEKMLAGGYEDPAGESTHAVKVIHEVFGQGGAEVIIKLDGPIGIDMAADPAARTVADDVIAQLEATGFVQQPILTIWNSPQLAAELLSRNKQSTLILASIDGDDSTAPAMAKQLDTELTGIRHGIEIKVGGAALVYTQVNEQTSKDLFIAEAIAIPISFLLLIVIFGGAIAAALPVLIGVVAIVVTLALLRAITSVAYVSIFALNLATAMGLALAIDYTLLIVTRYREEVDRGQPRTEAIVRTIDTAGRTVIFSGITVALSMAALAIFPMYFLRSFAYAGVGVVIVAVLAAIVLTPALLAVLGDRVDALDLRRGLRRLFGRPVPQPKPLEETFWYRSAQWVLKRAVPVAIVITALLVVLGLPFTGIRFGFPDERVLPESASVHALQQEIRDEYEQGTTSNLAAVVQGPADSVALSEYAAELSTVPKVAVVSSPVGVFHGGRLIAPTQPGLVIGADAKIEITGDVEPMQDAGQDQLAALRAVPPPPGTTVSFTGLAAVNADTVKTIYHYLP